ncbi:hypothetical protein D3C85_1413690 [compost metagenome]
MGKFFDGAIRRFVDQEAKHVCDQPLDSRRRGDLAIKGRQILVSTVLTANHRVTAVIISNVIAEGGLSCAAWPTQEGADRFT